MSNSRISQRATLVGIVALAAMSLAWAAPASAQAHLHGHLHGHHHGYGGPRVSLSLGPHYGPWGYAPYFHDPFFYSRRWNDRPIVIEQPAPQVYVEQPQAYAQAAPTNNDWYFCEAAQAYWPYIKECPGGWQRVVPQPPPPPQ
ncbi:MAG: hypothetical protein KA388_07115 [Rhodocyclaceae bacterium]|nr:hypothetical protein [Rhodocyclaceae bacterium]